MTAATRVKVLIAHGDPLIQIGLEGALSACTDFSVQSMQDRPTDVAVADRETGLKLAAGERGLSCPVLIVTNDDSEVGVRGAMEAGVRGYVLLGSTLEAVAEAVRCVARGGTAIDPRAVTKMLDSLNGDKLTDREIDVLRLIMLGRSNKAVATELGIAVGTAKSHLKQLMSKLNARSRTEVASIALRRGLVPPIGATMTLQAATQTLRISPACSRTEASRAASSRAVGAW